MSQLSFAEAEVLNKKRVTRRARFLGEMQQLVPWAKLESVIGPHYYPNAGKGGAGRPPVGLNRMLRLYVAQQCLGLSDEGAEDAVYESVSVREFVGIRMSEENAPDATTLLKFRRLLEEKKLTEAMFATINEVLREKGLLLSKGSIVDATIIAAPPSTKNEAKARDADMHQV